MKSIDLLLSKVGTFAQSAEKKTHDVIEISQLKWKIVKIKSKIERKYKKLGALSYLNYQNGGREGVDVFSVKAEKVCGEIKELFCALRKAEQEYDDMTENSTNS